MFGQKLQSFECQVHEITEDSVWVDALDLKNDENPPEVMEITLDKLSHFQRPIREGSIFYFDIYENGHELKEYDSKVWLQEQLDRAELGMYMLSKYPRQCPECGNKSVGPCLVNKTIIKNHNGQLIELNIQDLPIVMCNVCGEEYFTTDSDTKVAEELNKKLANLP